MKLCLFIFSFSPSLAFRGRKVARGTETETPACLHVPLHTWKGNTRERERERESHKTLALRESTPSLLSHCCPSFSLSSFSFTHSLTHSHPPSLTFSLCPPSKKSPDADLDVYTFSLSLSRSMKATPMHSSLLGSLHVFLLRDVNTYSAATRPRTGRKNERTRKHNQKKIRASEERNRTASPATRESEIQNYHSVTDLQRCITPIPRRPMKEFNLIIS